jgi:hypothetical protein
LVSIQLKIDLEKLFLEVNQDEKLNFVFNEEEEIQTKNTGESSSEVREVSNLLFNNKRINQFSMDGRNVISTEGKNSKIGLPLVFQNLGGCEYTILNIIDNTYLTTNENTNLAFFDALSDNLFFNWEITDFLGFKIIQNVGTKKLLKSFHEKDIQYFVMEDIDMEQLKQNISDDIPPPPKFRDQVRLSDIFKYPPPPIMFFDDMPPPPPPPPEVNFTTNRIIRPPPPPRIIDNDDDGPPPPPFFDFSNLPRLDEDIPPPPPLFGTIKSKETKETKETKEKKKKSDELLKTISFGIEKINSVIKTELRLEEEFNNKKNSDITIKVKGEEIYLHKIVIIDCFRDISDKKEITLKEYDDFKLENIKLSLKYLYNQNFPNIDDMAIEDKYTNY